MSVLFETCSRRVTPHGGGRSVPHRLVVVTATALYQSMSPPAKRREFSIGVRLGEEARGSFQEPKARHRSASKVYKSADDAIADLQDGTTILSAGFGLCGVAGELPITPTLLYTWSRS